MRMVAVCSGSIYTLPQDEIALSDTELDINETKVLNVADQFVSLGLKDAGYEYINLDVRPHSVYE